MVTLKNDEEIAILRQGKAIIRGLMDGLGEQVGEGVSSLDLDQWVEAFCEKQNVKPAFKGYMGFKHCICASVNEVVVHGVPSADPLKEGDIISIDVGIIVSGLYLDTAYTFQVGAISKEATDLLHRTRAACMAGIEQCVVGKNVQDVSRAIEQSIVPFGYGIVKQYVGHGLGYELHEEPQIPNYDNGHLGMRLESGMTVAIEPMINLGSENVYVAEDGWSVRTRDGSLSAHFEHTVLIADKGPEILTYWPQETCL